MASGNIKKKWLDLKTKKGKIMLFSGISAVVAVAVAVAVPVALLVPGTSAPQGPLTPEQERAAFLKKYPNSLVGNTVVDLAFSPKPFAEATLPEDFELPSFVEEIAPRAFFGAKLPAKFVLPPNLKKIHTYAFTGAQLPDDFTLPDTVEFIGSYAFLLTTFKKRLVLPSALTYIGIQPDNPLASFAPFGGTTFEDGFVLPETLVAIADNAFRLGDPKELQGTSGLSTGVNLPETQAMVQSDFKIPAGATIGTYADGAWHYYQYTNLKVNIPTGTKWDGEFGAIPGAALVPDTTTTGS